MNKRDPRYLFGVDINSHLVNKAYCFDQNPEYHQDGKGNLRGLNILKKTLQSYHGNIYIFLTAQKLSFSRSDLPAAAYEAFFKFDYLKLLDHIEIKVDIGNKIQFPIAIVNLKEFDFEVDKINIFNNNRIYFIFSDYEMDVIGGMVDSWILRLDKSKGMSFDRNSMVSGLKKTDALAFFQYMPSYNTWYEAMSLVGPKHFVEDVIMPCIDRALSGQLFSLIENEE